eukprot:7646541-Alexandrium_andersonii.AAC.1
MPSSGNSGSRPGSRPTWPPLPWSFWPGTTTIAHPGGWRARAGKSDARGRPTGPPRPALTCRGRARLHHP